MPMKKSFRGLSRLRRLHLKKKQHRHSRHRQQQYLQLSPHNNLPEPSER